jgi:ABC-type lipoprotein release transport system permease subunit
MGRTLLVVRLASRDMRHHVSQAVLLVFAVTAATAILAMGLALSGVTTRPYQQTRAATRGPDVVAVVNSLSQAAPMARTAGVASASGPYPLAQAVVKVRGITAGAEVQGRGRAAAAVDQPKLTSGTWVRPGGVVLERAYAEGLGVGVGDRLTLNGRSFTVVGTAVTASVAPFPNLCYSGCAITGILADNGVRAKSMGTAWTTESDARALGSAGNPLRYVLNLKLSSPALAPAFAGRFATPAPDSPMINTWEDLSSSYGLLVADEQSVLVPGAALLGLLALATVAVLVGSRLAQYTRRVGLLKAAGATPGLVAATFLAENLVLALVSAGAGLGIGLLAAPLLTSPGAAMVGAPGAPSITPLMLGGVIGVALFVALASTLVPAIRAARISTVRALADAARTPRRHGALIGLSRRLPASALFGLRLVARRPRRSLLSAASVGVTVTGIVAVLAFHATVSGGLPGQAVAAGLASPVVSRDEQMLTVLTVALVILAVLNAVFTAWATVLDARHASALIRALGASPGQVRTGLAAVQVLSALPGAIIGVPLGIVLFKAVSGGQAASPSASWLAATVLGTLLAVAGLTTVPTHIGTRQSAAVILQAETA